MPDETVWEERVIALETQLKDRDALLSDQAEAIVAHAEHSISEDAIVAAARERALDIGAGAVTPAVGALLCVLAKLTGAKAVVEVGHMFDDVNGRICPYPGKGFGNRIGVGIYEVGIVVGDRPVCGRDGGFAGVGAGCGHVFQSFWVASCSSQAPLASTLR